MTKTDAKFFDGKQAVLLSATLVYLTLIYYFSSQSSLKISLQGFYGHMDKVAHMGEYFILGFLLFYNVAKWQKKWAFAIAVLVSGLYGVSDEIHQAFVPLRDSDVLDTMADLVGGLCGAFIGKVVKTVL
jgi:VanZ family protein